MNYVIFLAIFLSLISSLIGSFFAFSEKNRYYEIIATSLICISAVCSFIIFKNVILDKNLYKIILFDFIKVFNFDSKFTIRIDSLGASMLLLVNFVSACVNIYSLSYMSDDKNINRFFAYLSMFTFFMIILITSDDFLQLFVGWEGVGVSSYALISFWFKKNSASSAANKAFIVNRIGDFGLIIGIGFCYFVFQTINFSEIYRIFPSYIDHQTYLFGLEINSINLICFFIFIGCMGKSAQIGLHVWLPDAMEGPTPVSALIHAATMVTAGVFLLCRMNFIFDYSDVKYLIFILSGLTAIFAASVACFQTDIKKIIAYSTCSQLGYMFMGCAASGYNASMFHLLTHGFFKALLFLSAGSIIHSTLEQNINKMPNSLFKIMPFTFILMLLGTLAITGIPPFAGFYSKDAIIHYIQSSSVSDVIFSDGVMKSKGMFEKFSTKFAYFSALLTVFITAFYSWKIIFKSFFNNNLNSNNIHSNCNSDTQNHKPHESDFKILIPMFFLAVLSFSSGFIFENILKILDNSKIYWGESLSSKILLHENHSMSFFEKYLPLVLSLLGGVLSYYRFMIKGNEDNENSLKKEDCIDLINIKKLNIFVKILENKFYFDEIYNKIFVKNLFCISNISAYFDKEIFDRIFINGLRGISYGIARKVSNLHSGILYTYIFWQIFLLFCFIFYIFFLKIS
jgi:NADH-quinone oxidoreductase subunit L